MPEQDVGRGSILLCYDGSEFARRAIEDSAVVLGGGPAVALTIFESMASALLRQRRSDKTEMGSEFKQIAEEVVDELDAGAAERAEATAAEGAELAEASGFAAGHHSRRAVARTAERDTTTVWRAILDFADEQDSSVIVVGARGASRIGSALLGSVSYGLLHNSGRPILVMPPARQR